jgi:hypothetical protein
MSTIMSQAVEAVTARVKTKEATPGGLSIFVPLIMEFITMALQNCLKSQTVAAVAEEIQQPQSVYRRALVRQAVNNLKDDDGHRVSLDAKEKRALRDSFNEESADTPPEVCAAFVAEIDDVMPEWNFFA